VETFADRIDSMMKALGAPRRLSEVGVKTEDIEGIVKRGLGRSTAWNPKPMTEKDLIRICKTIL